MKPRLWLGTGSCATAVIPGSIGIRPISLFFSPLILFTPPMNPNPALLSSHQATAHSTSSNSNSGVYLHNLIHRALYLFASPTQSPIYSANIESFRDRFLFLFLLRRRWLNHRDFDELCVFKIAITHFNGTALDFAACCIKNIIGAKEQLVKQLMRSGKGNKKREAFYDRLSSWSVLSNEQEINILVDLPPFQSRVD